MLCDGLVLLSVSDAYVVAVNCSKGGSGVTWLRNYLAGIPDSGEGIPITAIDLNKVRAGRKEREKRYYWRLPKTYGLLLDVEVEHKVHGNYLKKKGKPSPADVQVLSGGPRGFLAALPHVSQALRAAAANLAHGYGPDECNMPWRESGKEEKQN